MNWYVHVLIHIAAMYPLIGLYLGVMWYWFSNEAGNHSIFERVIMPIVMMGLWPFDVQPADGANLRPLRKSAVKKEQRAELTRMARAERDTEAHVKLLEASAQHRKTMAELEERRVKAEEVS